jgi:hypothetical protein
LRLVHCGLGIADWLGRVQVAISGYESPMLSPTDPQSLVNQQSAIDLQTTIPNGQAAIRNLRFAVCN